MVSLFVLIAAAWKRALIMLGRGSAVDLDERLARKVPAPMTPGRGIVVNAVSVGEVAAAEKLLHALRARMPDLEVVITTGNRDGSKRAEQLRNRMGGPITVMYLPWDRKRALSRWLRAAAPVALLSLETELWPNLFRTCRDLGIPALIANGRIYEKDVWRYKLARRFFREVLSCVEWIGVPGEAERSRFQQIGADPSRVEVVGNIKMDSYFPGQDESDERVVNIRNTGRPLIVAGSTHKPEEEMILDAFLKLRWDHEDMRLVLAPRHVRRAGEISQLCQSRNLPIALWSDQETLNKTWDVLVLDQVGVLTSFYSLGPVVIMGGTFAKKGGHNIAEAAAYGCAVVTGPSVGNFREMVGEFDAEGGIVRTDRPGLVSVLHRLLTDKNLRESIGARARRVVLRHSGCSDRYASAILSRISGGLLQMTGERNTKQNGGSVADRSFASGHAKSLS